MSDLLPDNSTWSDYPVDMNNDLEYERLNINLGTPTETHHFAIQAILKNSTGAWIGRTETTISPQTS